MKVMTFNMRDDGLIPFSKWKVRLDGFIELLIKEKPDIIGTQEMTYKAKVRLKKLLIEKGIDYSFYGESRKRTNGLFDEYNTILVKSNIKVLSTYTYSLSDSPTVPLTKFVRDKFPRIMTFVELENCYLYNTHLTNKVDDNKFLQLKCITKLLKRDKPVIFTGDFNLGMTRLRQFCTDNCFVDTTKGIGYTYITKKHRYHLDHILINNNMNFSNVKKHTNLYKSLPLSDHYPVSVDIDL